MDSQSISPWFRRKRLVGCITKHQRLRTSDRFHDRGRSTHAADRITDWIRWLGCLAVASPGPESTTTMGVEIYSEDSTTSSRSCSTTTVEPAQSNLISCSTVEADMVIHVRAAIDREDQDSFKGNPWADSLIRVCL